MMEVSESCRIFYKDGYRAQLVRDAYFWLCEDGECLPLEQDVHAKFYSIHKNGLVIGRAGYAWNFGNKPAINTKAMKYASCGHDIICQAVREGYLPHRPYRLKGDTMFRRLLLKAGAWKARAWWCFKAVKAAGNKPPKHVGENIKFAP